MLLRLSSTLQRRACCAPLRVHAPPTQRGSHTITASPSLGMAASQTVPTDWKPEPKSDRVAEAVTAAEERTVRVADEQAANAPQMHSVNVTGQPPVSTENVRSSVLQAVKAAEQQATSLPDESTESTPARVKSTQGMEHTNQPPICTRSIVACLCSCCMH